MRRASACRGIEPHQVVEFLECQVEIRRLEACLNQFPPYRRVILGMLDGIHIFDGRLVKFLLLDSQVSSGCMDLGLVGIGLVTGQQLCRDDDTYQPHNKRPHPLASFIGRLGPRARFPIPTGTQHKNPPSCKRILTSTPYRSRRRSVVIASSGLPCARIVPWYIKTTSSDERKAWSGKWVDFTTV